MALYSTIYKPHLPVDMELNYEPRRHTHTHRVPATFFFQGKHSIHILYTELLHAETHTTHTQGHVIQDKRLEIG